MSTGRCRNYKWVYNIQFNYRKSTQISLLTTMLHSWITNSRIVGSHHLSNEQKYRINSADPNRGSCLIENCDSDDCDLQYCHLVPRSFSNNIKFVCLAYRFSAIDWLTRLLLLHQMDNAMIFSSVSTLQPLIKMWMCSQHTYLDITCMGSSTITTELGTDALARYCPPIP